MADTISVGQMVAGQATNGQVLEYGITLTPGKYVVQLSGTPVEFGIWAGSGPNPPGILRVCGGNAWGCRTFGPGPHYVRVTAKADGAFTFLMRPWTFWDYWPFLANQHPSTC